MKMLTQLRSHALWLRLQLPVALLVTLLQRSPAVRVLAAADELVASSRLGAVLQSALAATASFGALHSLAGATTLVASTPGPLTAKVGAPVPTVAFTVTDTINIASWQIGGSLPPGVQIAAREGPAKLSAPGMLDVTTPGMDDGYGGSIGGIQSTTPFLTGTPTQPGTYTITLQAYEFAGLSGLASNTFSYAITVAADVTPPANVAPTIAAQPQSQAVASGTNVTFTVAANGTPAPTIQWQKNGAVIAGATSATLTLSSVATADAGTYTAVVTNSAGTVTTAAAVLSVTPPVTNGTPASILAQPATQSVASGSTVVFNIAASGTPAPSYQWRKDGVNISGATGPILIVPNATAAQAGSYSVAVTNSAGTVTSTAASLAVSNVPVTSVGRLANLSILTTAGSGAKTLTIGATVGGTGTSGALPLVIRAVGPTLGQAPFNIGGVLPDPVMTLNAAGNATPLATDAGWGGSATLATAFSNVGAFALPTSSLDSAIVPASPGLAGGGYTVQVTSNSNASGIVIAEMYDAAGSARTATTPRLTNLSTLTAIDTGANLAVGFVIGGSSARTLLVRGIGPTLNSAFGIGGVMADPKLELFNNSTGAKIMENDDWAGDASLVAANASVGAFPLANGATKDAVLLVTLPPGQYSARVSGADGGGGTAIIEVYEVP